MPVFLLPLAGAFLGLIIGSFLATLVLRWPQERSVMTGRSACDHCGHRLAIRELVPVVSFFLQAGKCRKCGAPIATDHVAIELAAGLIGGLALFAAPGPIGLAGALFGWLLLTLAALDVNHHWLPDRLTAVLALSGLAAGLVTPLPTMTDRLIGGAAGWASLALIAIAYKRIRRRDGLGGGDPKMLGAIGCWLGWQALPLVLLGASLCGLLVALSWRWRGGAVTSETLVPLGSLMAVAAFPLWLFQYAAAGPLYGF